MAVNMSNVKQIMHNNKEVIKIEDSLGHIIWQKEKITATTTVTFTGEELEGLCTMNTGDNPSTYQAGIVSSISGKSLSSVKSAIATKMGLTSSDIVDVTPTSLNCYWVGATYTSSGNELKGKGENSTSAEDILSKRNSGYGDIRGEGNVPSVQIVKGGTTVYAAYRYATNGGTYSYGPYMTSDTSRRTVIYPIGYNDRKPNGNMTVTVTYNK